MIDIHCHVLPGLDDGARDREEALAMLRMAREAGTAGLVATPHANEEFRFDPQAVERILSGLQQAAGGAPRLYYGCELHLTPENIEHALRFPSRYTLAHRGCLLAEFSDFFIPKSAGQILDRLMGAGMRPILAHPERHPILRGRIGELAGWVEQGCLVQVTAQSLLGGFGRSAKASAEELIERGLAHFVASDGHDTRRRPPVLDAAWHSVEQSFGRNTAERLLETNPQALLAGDPIERVLPGRRAKFRFACW